MRNRLLPTIGAGACILLSSCQAQSHGPLAGASPTPAKIQQLSGQIAQLQQDVATLKRETALAQMQRYADGFAYLTPGDNGFAFVNAGLGHLTVQLSDVVPYANGSKVILKFGNPFTASMNGLKATLDWGQTAPDGTPINATENTKDFTFSQTIRAGMWTSVPVILEGVPPSRLGFVRVRNVSLTGISLMK